MLNTVRSKSFLAGFFLGLLSFLAANIYTYDDGAGVFGIDSGATMAECFDCVKRFGWPFRLHQSGTIMHVDEVLWMGLSADIFIAVCASAIVGALTHLLFNARNWRKGLKEKR
jgi:hypothetical protein